ncbi:hypothetical protein OG234_13430 [Streptomyces sp. NBC_01420]|uniref:hypothetical protein n=1 Tax=Streptomyces sp. NBC_01420 TaxID=2903858 RepID=UPI00324DCB0D
MDHRTEDAAARRQQELDQAHADFDAADAAEYRLFNTEMDLRDAAAAERAGRYQEAARIYQQVGEDLKDEHGPYDPRALDAFERAARAVRQSAEASP